MLTLVGSTTFQKDIQRRLREYRKRAKLSQKQLADKLGVDKSRYAKWETRSTPQAEFIPGICKELKVTAWFLLTGDLVEEHMVRDTPVTPAPHPPRIGTTPRPRAR